MDVPSISERGRATPPSPIRKLVPYAEAAKARGVKIYHLNIGQPDIPTPPEFFEAVHRFDGKVLAYGHSKGLASFLRSLKDYYCRVGYTHIETEDIVATTGGSEAVIFAMMAITSPDDEIITFEPFYTNYNGFAHMAGITLVPVGTDPETGYHLPPRERIEAKITPRTKGILLCTPNNPTGTVYRREEIEEIEELVLRHNLFVLSDEVYREFVYEGEHTSILSFPRLMQHAVLLDSLSKRYSVCGARVGCVVSKNSDVVETILKFGQARLCSATLEQVAASAAVDAGDKYFEKMIREYKLRRDTVFNGLLEIPGVTCKRPKGAFYVMTTFPVDDIEDFSRWLLTDFDVGGETTMIAPGPGFYATPGKGMREARIAYVLNADDLKKSKAV